MLLRRRTHCSPARPTRSITIITTGWPGAPLGIALQLFELRFQRRELGAGRPSIHPWPGIAGWKLSSIRNPVTTVLVVEFPALLPYSWHQPGGQSHYNNARDMVSFVDGHVNYIKLYWNTNNPTTGNEEAWHYDPPAGYDYRWSGN